MRSPAEARFPRRARSRAAARRGAFEHKSESVPGRSLAWQPDRAPARCRDDRGVAKGFTETAGAAARRQSARASADGSRGRARDEQRAGLATTTTANDQNQIRAGSERPSAALSFCFLRIGNNTTAVPMPARATMISRMPPTIAESVRTTADDVVRTLYWVIKSEGRVRDQGKQIKYARR
jgi:hypothetical protein